MGRRHGTGKDQFILRLVETGVQLVGSMLMIGCAHATKNAVENATGATISIGFSKNGDLKVTSTDVDGNTVKYKHGDAALTFTDFVPGTVSPKKLAARKLVETQLQVKKYNQSTKEAVEKVGKKVGDSVDKMGAIADQILYDMLVAKNGTLTLTRNFANDMKDFAATEVAKVHTGVEQLSDVSGVVSARAKKAGLDAAQEAKLAGCFADKNLTPDQMKAAIMQQYLDSLVINEAVLRAHVPKAVQAPDTTRGENGVSGRGNESVTDKIKASLPTALQQAINDQTNEEKVDLSDIFLKTTSITTTDTNILTLGDSSSDIAAEA